MRHLIGVMTYQMTTSLEVLVNLMSDEMDILLHVDAKSDLQQYDIIKDKVSFIDQRVPVFWGDVSQIKAMLAIFSYAKKFNYDYVSLVSESDLPLKKPEDINLFLEQHLGSEYIGYSIKGFEEADERLKYRYFNFYKKRGNPLRYLFKKFKLYKLFKNKCYRILPKLYKGSQWMTLSRNAIKYIFDFLEQNPSFIKAFESSYCPDEVFFQTILFNSPLKENIFMIENPPLDDNAMSLRYIDWETGPTFPTVLKAENLRTYQQAQPKSLFFRKVDEKSDFDRYLYLLENEDGMRTEWNDNV